MANAITISLAINAALGVGWLVRAKAANAEVSLDSVRLMFADRFEASVRHSWTPTKIAIRAEGSELSLYVYGSLDAPESWARDAPPVVYVYPDPNVTVGDVVAALDRIAELAPAKTIVVTELSEGPSP